MDVKTEFEKYVISKYPQISKEFVRQYELEQTKHVAVQSPYILEEHEIRATSMDIFSRLLMERQIFFASQVMDDTASIVIAQLLYLANQGKEEIKMYVMSPGGSCSAGLGIIDTMGFVMDQGVKIRTINVGMAASMGVVIAACGSRGLRQTLPNAKFLIHQPLISGGGVSGPTDDIEIEANEMKKLKTRLFGILAQRTGKTVEEITKDAARDFWLDADEALAYGLVDEIIKINWD